jgi:hypothetical protein
MSVGAMQHRLFIIDQCGEHTADSYRHSRINLLAQPAAISTSNKNGVRVILLQ